MKTRKTAIIAIVALALICAVLIVLLIKPPFLSWATVRLYLGDRMTVSLHVTVDGTDASVSRESGDYRLSGSPGDYTLSARANDKEAYEYTLSVKSKSGESFPVTVRYAHFNWWEIIEGDVTLEIDTETNRYKYHNTFTYTAEEGGEDGNGTKYSYKDGSNSGAKKIDDGIIINFGY